jgi:hypothetical protein
MVMASGAYGQQHCFIAEKSGNSGILRFSVLLPNIDNETFTSLPRTEELAVKHFACLSAICYQCPCSFVISIKYKMVLGALSSGVKRLKGEVDKVEHRLRTFPCTLLCNFTGANLLSD